MQSAIYPANSAGSAESFNRTRQPAAEPRRGEKSFAQPEKSLASGKFDNLSDAELVAQCRTNDSRAAEALVARYARYIHSLAYGLARNHDDASDLFSITAIQIIRHIATFERAVTLPAWIKRIVTNAYIDMRRTAERRPAVSLDALVEASGDNLLVDNSRPQMSPHQCAERNERGRILDAAIRLLPRAQREMVTLFHTQQESYEDISVRLRVPIGTVKSRLNRARTTLRQSLMPQMSMLVS